MARAAGCSEHLRAGRMRTCQTRLVRATARALALCRPTSTPDNRHVEPRPQRGAPRHEGSSRGSPQRFFPTVLTAGLHGFAPRRYATITVVSAIALDEPRRGTLTSHRTHWHADGSFMVFEVTSPVQTVSSRSGESCRRSGIGPACSTTRTSRSLPPMVNRPFVDRKCAAGTDMEYEAPLASGTTHA